MENIINIILVSGKTGVNIALYILLPVMVVMMALMSIMEAKGVLAWTAKFLSKPLKIFGIPGLGVFAALQIMLVSFAAPLATLNIMEKDESIKRKTAATLAMVFTMSQANVLFPMAAVGLNLPVIFATSVIGGLVAACSTYYIFARLENCSGCEQEAMMKSELKDMSLYNIIMKGGSDAVQVVIKSIPLLVLAIFFVNILKEVGGIALLEKLLTPVLAVFGVKGTAVLPIATKFLAGGTAMMGVTMDLIQQGIMTAKEFNRIAGFILNPFDLVGVAVLASAGPRVASIAKPAIYGAILGIAVRGIIHLIIF